MEEPSAYRVTAILQERGFQVANVEPVAQRPGLRRVKTRLSWEDLTLLNQQLLAVAKSGLPFAPALKALAQDVKGGRLKPVLRELQRDLESGASLNEAVEKHPQAFPPLYASMIRAGERTGNLSGVLGMLGAHSNRMLDIKTGLYAALAYPVTVAFLAAFLVVFLIVKVVPVFAEIFTDFGSALPAPTQRLVDISGLLTGLSGKSYFLMAAVAFAGYLLYRAVRRSESGNVILDRIKLRIPFFGRTFRTSNLVLFSRSLGLLLFSEVPVLESLDLAGAASNNALLRRKTRQAATLVAGGTGIAQALSSTGYFPHAFCWLLSNAETRGQVPETLISISESYGRELSARDQVFSRMLGPVVVVALGLAIGYIVMALYLPIFTLGDAVSGG